MSNCLDKASVQIIHAVSGEDFFDDDDLFAMVAVPRLNYNYYFISLIDDRRKGTNCVGSYWGNLSTGDLDAFIRKSVVGYWKELYDEDGKDFIWEAIENLELHYL